MGKWEGVVKMCKVYTSLCKHIQKNLNEVFILCLHFRVMFGDGAKSLKPEERQFK